MAHIRRVKIVEIEAAAQMLDELVEALETGAESEIVLTLNGVPQARLLPALPQEEVGEDPQPLTIALPAAPPNPPPQGAGDHEVVEGG